MNLDFTGKAAIVTGAAHGFGRAIGVALAERGAHVWACDVLEDELRETEALCRSARGSCRAIVTDVRDRSAVEACVAAASAASGHVDILVNNAGGVLGQIGRPLEQITPDEWRAIFDVNVTGAFYFSQAVAPGMKAARRGRIVNISSGAGLGISLTGIQAYACGEGRRRSEADARSWLTSFGPWGITGQQHRAGVRSDPTRRPNASGESYGAGGAARAGRSDRAQRLGTPYDIAYGVLFFASEYAGWITDR
jgi:3-oxoacyl-[acyl-carrier protein] reductase